MDNDRWKCPTNNENDNTKNYEQIFSRTPEMKKKMLRMYVYYKTWTNAEQQEPEKNGKIVDVHSFSEKDSARKREKERGKLYNELILFVFLEMKFAIKSMLPNMELLWCVLIAQYTILWARTNDEEINGEK